MARPDPSFPSSQDPGAIGEAGRPVFERSITCAAAALALLIVPVYQLIDVISGRTPSDLLWLHAAWRVPAFLVALACLTTCLMMPEAGKVRLLLRALAGSFMLMIFGLFTTDVLHERGDPEQMARGIIMATFAISLLALRGGREVLTLFAIPLGLSLGWLALQNAGMLKVFELLVDPLMMLVIAMIASELFYRVRSRQFTLEYRLRELASTDALTGLHNRRELERRIAEEMSRSRRHQQPLSVVIGDLDHFKRVNDEYGHTVGDEVLRAVGERMRHNLRAEDLAVRWGGEEFLLLLPSTALEQAVQVADKIRQAVAERPIECDGLAVSVTISFGVAQLAGEEEVAVLIRRADDAMYRAKTGGRNRVCN